MLGYYSIEWMKSVPTLAATVMTVIAYVAIIIWSWMRKKQFIYEGVSSRHWILDLRIWATAALVVQIILYVLLA